MMRFMASASRSEPRPRTVLAAKMSDARPEYGWFTESDTTTGALEPQPISQPQPPPQRPDPAAPHTATLPPQASDFLTAFPRMEAASLPMKHAMESTLFPSANGVVTDPANTSTSHARGFAASGGGGVGGGLSFPEFSPATAEILRRVGAAKSGSSVNWQTAREQVQNMMKTSDKIAPPPPLLNHRRSRGGAAARTAAAVPNVPRAQSVTNPPGAPVPGSEVPTGGKPAEAPQPCPQDRASAPVRTSTPTQPGSASRGRGGARGRGRGRGSGGKRKREESSDTEYSVTSDVSSDFIPMPVKTKSGRNVNKPSVFIPPPFLPPGKRRKSHRRGEATACKTCQRSQSMPNNEVVVCDDCSTPYHQYCHDPPIDRDASQASEKEWLCSSCAKPTATTDGESPNKLISSADLTEEQKRRYLLSLPSVELVNLLLKACERHPDLAFFAPATGVDMEMSQRPDMSIDLFVSSSSSHNHNTNSSTHDMGGVSSHHIRNGEDDYDGYDTDPPAHYPKPGNGLFRTLPPDSEDLERLVDENTQPFSHRMHDV
ncbi:hypothetical protein BDY21DRAFT_303220 [Lineolata rhizophorae]|uniref:PHD-type domain-containing protein n=1 Tax=Lineolata rhizophorae TaxID=578093 RepID=A0A6A6P2K9_9PEZI|nr:hypothetical protein BDY21DRAFT_303220 [Lineolata rhizophorae]